MKMIKFILFIFMMFGLLGIMGLMLLFNKKRILKNHPNINNEDLVERCFRDTGFQMVIIAICYLIYFNVVNCEQGYYIATNQTRHLGHYICI